MRHGAVHLSNRHFLEHRTNHPAVHLKTLQTPCHLFTEELSISLSTEYLSQNALLPSAMQPVHDVSAFSEKPFPYPCCVPLSCAFPQCTTHTRQSQSTSLDTRCCCSDVNKTDRSVLALRAIWSGWEERLPVNN